MKKNKAKVFMAMGMTFLMTVESLFVPDFTISAKAETTAAGVAKATLNGIVLDASGLKPSYGVWTQEWDTEAQIGDPDNHD